MHTQIQQLNPWLTADRWKPLMWWNASFLFHISLCFEGCDLIELMCDLEGKTLKKRSHPVAFSLISYCSRSFSRIEEQRQLVFANPSSPQLTPFNHPRIPAITPV